MIGSQAGVYLREDLLTVAVVGRRGSLQCFTLESGDLPGARLKAEIETRQLKLRRMRVGLARQLMTVKILELPHTSQSQLAEMIGFDLERHVPFPPEDIRFDFKELPESLKGTLRVLVAASERRTVEGALKLLEEPRLKAGAVTAACHDLPALIRRRPRPRHSVWAHRSGGMTDLLCLSQGRLELSRTVPVKDGDELANEMSATFNLLGWRECDAIWVSGDDTPDFLASPGLGQFGAEVSEPPWNARAQALIPKLPAEESAGAAVLALATALGGKRPVLNLLPVELRPRALTTGQIVTAATASVAALLGLALLAGQGYKQHRYATRLTQAIRALDPQVKRVEGLSAELAQKRRLLETIRGIEKTDVRPLPLLKELTERIPQEAWLRTLSMDKQGLDISGQAGAANQLIPLLENSPSLERVEFTAPVTKAGDKEQFRIKAAWKNAPKPPDPVAKAAPPAAPPARATTRPAPPAGPGRQQ